MQVTAAPGMPTGWLNVRAVGYRAPIATVEHGLILLVRAEVEELRGRGGRGQEDDASDAIRRVYLT